MNDQEHVIRLAANRIRQRHDLVEYIRSNREVSGVSVKVIMFYTEYSAGWSIMQAEPRNCGKEHGVKREKAERELFPTKPSGSTTSKR